MADLLALLQPRVVDRETLREFIEALEDQIPGIEHDIAALRTDPTDRTLIAQLFRALHTIKGDAAICKVDVGVAICHPIESLLARCREGEIVFSHLIAELTLLALDRLELTVEALSLGRAVDHLKLPELVGGLETVAVAAAHEISARAARTIEAITGFKPLHTADNLGSGETASLNRSADLAFFRELALQLESRSPLLKGRTERILRLAFDTNAATGSPIAPVQLEAAIYMHDIGMMFVPEPVWLKVGKLTDDDKKALRAHPTQAAGLLQRMSGWTTAAEMVAQHHEMPDGKGYPEGLTGDKISPGAKLLAIVDAFEAVTLKHSHRGQTRSLIRAIAEINACDNQFAAEWIDPFNGVIRQMVENG